jgi:hypothetical protein
MRRIGKPKEWRFERRICKEERLSSILYAAGARHFFGQSDDCAKLETL